MAEPKLIICNCQNEFQDKEYGKNKRLANHAPKKGAENNRYRCTVCKKEHQSK